MSWENMKSRIITNTKISTPINKHIRFDDTKDDQDSKPIINQMQRQNQSFVKLQQIDLKLVKNLMKKEQSFGFELKGDAKKHGDHYVESVEANSAAGRALMKPNDKIISVNGVNVENYNINSLFDLLEYETELNDIKLNLVVLRNVPYNGETIESSSHTWSTPVKRCNFHFFKKNFFS
jgi:C-terminal processing protease CtpA/Prc